MKMTTKEKMSSARQMCVECLTTSENLLKTVCSTNRTVRAFMFLFLLIFLFVKLGTQAELKSLIKFWVGWELPAEDMKLEVVNAVFPSAMTCFEKLRLPRHYTSYHTFHRELCACIATTDFGFGCT